MSDVGLGLEKQIKAWSPPRRNSGNDRFSRGKLSAKGPYMERVSNSDWDSLAGGCPEERDV